MRSARSFTLAFIITSSPKVKDRSSESQKEKSSKYLEKYVSKRAIVFSGPNNSDVSSFNLSKIKSLSSFYAFSYTSNFDDDSIKNEQASRET